MTTNHGGVITGTAQNPSVQRAGAILRGNGPAGRWVGVDGNVYFDITNLLLYRKWDGAWGAFVFTIPPSPTDVVSNLKWYGDAPPGPDVGRDGDYYILWSSGTGSVYPLLYGPKVNGGWQAIAYGALRPYSLDNLVPLGVDDEGALTHALPTTMILCGVDAETTGYQDNSQSDMLPLGISQDATEVNWTLNPEYTG